MLTGRDRQGKLTISFIPLSSSSFSSAYKYKGTHSNRTYPSHLLQLLFSFSQFSFQNFFLISLPLLWDHPFCFLNLSCNLHIVKSTHFKYIARGVLIFVHTHLTPTEEEKNFPHLKGSLVFLCPYYHLAEVNMIMPNASADAFCLTLNLQIDSLGIYCLRSGFFHPYCSLKFTRHPAVVVFHWTYTPHLSSLLWMLVRLSPVFGCCSRSSNKHTHISLLVNTNTNASGAPPKWNFGSQGKHTLLPSCFS